MNPKTTGLLALIALGLGAFVYLYEIGGDPQREAAKDDAARIFAGLESEDVTAVELTTQEGTPVRFERTSGTWRATRPVSAPADQTALDAISHALTHLPRKGDVEAPRALDEYGLGESARVIRFELTGPDGAQQKALRIGRATPVGGYLYVNAEDENLGADGGRSPVAFVESYRVNAFNRKWVDLRERRIFGFEPGGVTSLSLTWASNGGTERVDLKRGRDALWQMTHPAAAQADEETVRELLSNLSFLKAQSFMDTRTDAADQILSRPMIEIAWRLGAASEPMSARIAESTRDGELLVDAGAGSKAAYRIAAERLNDFPRTVNAYRFKQLASFELVAARRVEFELVDRSGAGGEAPEVVRIAAELQEAGWTSADRVLNPDRISNLVRELSTLRAADIFADEMGRAERASLGLEPPASVIRVLGQGEEAPIAEISIGRQDAGRGLFVQRAGDPTIYVLDAARAADLPISLGAFESLLEVVPDAGGAEGDADSAFETGADTSTSGLQEYEVLDGLESP